MSHFDISAAILGINIWDIDIGNIGIFFYFGDIIEKYLVNVLFFIEYRILMDFKHHFQYPQYLSPKLDMISPKLGISLLEMLSPIFM